MKTSHLLFPLLLAAELSAQEVHSDVRIQYQYTITQTERREGYDHKVIITNTQELRGRCKADWDGTVFRIDRADTENQLQGKAQVQAQRITQEDNGCTSVTEKFDVIGRLDPSEAEFGFEYRMRNNENQSSFNFFRGGSL